MKLSVTRDSLHSGMGAVSATIPTKTTLPVLSNILLDARDGKLTLSGTDLDISVSVSIDAEVEEEGSVTVPAKKFAEIARELPAAPVHIRTDGVEIQIEGGKSRFKLFGLPTEEFPSFPEVDSGDAWTMQAADLHELISKTSFAVSSEESRPILMTVRQPAHSPPGEADVFITSEVDYAETYVQAQVLYRIKVYRAVPTRQPALRDPEFSGAEVLIEIAGEERSYDARLNGRTYNVVERVYAVFPQESGEVTISPARFEARVLRDGRITGRKVFESEPLSVTVLPIPDRPADFPNATWLPAKDLQLSEDWSRDTDEVKAGEPLTRRVSISALGQLETQIPALEPPATSGINVYPDKPELSRSVEAGGIRGVRSDQYAMIGVTPGDVVLPALEIPWWNTGTAQWELATLPERTLTILPSGEAAPPRRRTRRAASTKNRAMPSSPG